MGASRRKGTVKGPSLGEAEFVRCWDLCGGDEKYVTEHRFHPKRRFRFDFAFLSRHVAVEIEGGHWSGGRHVRGTGFERDCEKYNLAASFGWVVLRFTPSMIRTDPGGCAALVQGVLDDRAG